MRSDLIRRSAAVVMISLAALTASARPAAAVNVSPAVVVIDARTREGVVTLTNGGRHPEEIDLSFQYGSHASDQDGNVRLVLTDSAEPGQPSALGWVSAFPRRMVLAPGESQVVRIIARPPAGLATGEYWARLVVAAVPQSPTVEERRGDATLQLRVGTRIIAAVHYRAGRLTSGVTVSGAQAARDSSGIGLLLNLERVGNAAFIGRLRARLLAADGTQIGDEYVEAITLYQGVRRRFRIPAASDGAARAVSVAYTLDGERYDLPPGSAIRVQPVTGDAPINGGRAVEAGGSQ